MPQPLKIVCAPNGPALIEGPCEILDATGKSHAIEPGKRAAICRCGSSERKPFCDGSHSRCGFKDPKIAEG